MAGAFQVCSSLVSTQVGRVDDSAAIVMSMRVKYNIHLDGKLLESFVGTSRKHLYDHKPALELR